MTTVVYFVRHAQPNYENHSDELRELTEKGRKDRCLVTARLQGIHVDAVLSSPYLRAYDTVKPLADSRGLTIRTVEDFRERKVADGWIGNFGDFCRRQWADFSYRLPGGESLGQVRDRNIAALSRVLEEYRGQTVVIGGHGTAISTVLNFYDPSFGYNGFQKIKDRMPWMVRLEFEGNRFVSMEPIDVFETK